MQYLAGWRMHLARRMRRESNVGIAELAARVGYESEAAFSRAFPARRWCAAGDLAGCGGEGVRAEGE